MSFQSTILAPLDAIRSIGGILGLRPFTVTVRKRAWSGARVGLGTQTDTDTVLSTQTPAGTLQRVRVRQVTRRDVVASGGLYTERDLKVGPLTPLYSATGLMGAGGADDGSVEPQPTGASVELFWNVASPSGTFGVPPGGAWFTKVGEEATGLHTLVFLRAGAQKP